MKIILNGKFLRASMTGVHRVAYELGNALADLKAAGDPAVAGFEFEVWHPHDGAERAKSLRLPCRMVGPLTSIPWEQLTLPMRKGPSTLLNLCNIGPALSADAITMVHDVQVHLSPESYSRPFRVWYHFIQPLFARRHRLLLTVSHFSAREIAAVGLAPLDRVRVVHNGVDHVLRTPSEPAILERLALAPRRYVIGLATAQVHKNVGLLLQAFARPELAGLTLVLFGSGSAAAFESAGHKVPANIVFAGRVSDGELRALYESGLALAFPSTTEGFGLPPLESMLVGCPAVVAACGALPEVVGDAALQLPPDDPAAWAQALARLASDEAEWRDWSARGRARASQFSWSAAARTLASALRESASWPRHENETQRSQN